MRWHLSSLRFTLYNWAVMRRNENHPNGLISTGDMHKDFNRGILGVFIIDHQLMNLATPLIG
jgi:hypothetical protein